MEINYNIDHYSDDDLLSIINIENGYTKHILDAGILKFSELILDMKEPGKDEKKLIFLVELKERLLEKMNGFLGANKVLEEFDNEYKEDMHYKGVEVDKSLELKIMEFDKLVTIDSNFRRIYDQRCSCNDVDISTFKLDTPDDFMVIFNDNINEVTSLEIKSLELTHAWYNFQNVKGNTSFKINNSIVTIMDGNFLPTAMVSELDNGMSILDLINEVDGISDLEYSYDIRTNKIKIKNTSVDNDISLCFYDKELSDKNNAKLDFNLGQMLGFTQQKYVLVKGESIVGEHTINLYGPKYFYMSIDDYTNNYFTQSMTLQRIDKDVFKQSEYFRDREYVRDTDDKSLIPNYSRGGSQQAELKTVTEKLTISQKKTIEEINLAKANQYQNRTYGPNVVDIIARIPIKYDEDNDVRKWSPIIYEDLHNYKRIYNKPVNISKLRIRLFDDRGFPMGMKNDWSMGLVFKTNYKYRDRL
jgi:hypothetical protein